MASQSLDMNIIRALWDYLDRKNKKKPKFIQKLVWEVFQEAWNNILADSIAT